MRLSSSRLRQIVQEELLREGGRSLSVKSGEVPLLDEEEQAADLTRKLAALYEKQQMSYRTDHVMEMEDAYKQAVWDIKSQKMSQGDVYTLVGIAKAIVMLGLRGKKHDEDQ